MELLPASFLAWFVSIALCHSKDCRRRRAVSSILNLLSLGTGRHGRGRWRYVWGSRRSGLANGAGPEWRMAMVCFLGEAMIRCFGSVYVNISSTSTRTSWDVFAFL